MSDLRETIARALWRNERLRNRLHPEDCPWEYTLPLTRKEFIEDADAAIAALGLVEGRWWRMVGPDGGLWCETSDEREARDSMRPGDTLERQWVATITEWRPMR